MAAELRDGPFPLAGAGRKLKAGSVSDGDVHPTNRLIVLAIAGDERTRALAFGPRQPQANQLLRHTQRIARDDVGRLDRLIGGQQRCGTAAGGCGTRDESGWERLEKRSARLRHTWAVRHAPQVYERANGALNEWQDSADRARATEHSAEQPSQAITKCVCLLRRGLTPSRTGARWRPSRGLAHRDR